MTPTRAAAIVLAAGAGRRLGAELPKAFLSLGDRPILSVAAAAAAACDDIGAIVVTAPPGYEDVARGCVEVLPLPCVVVTGGTTRQASVRAALEALGADVEIVAVHDAARPFAPPDLFSAVIEAVLEGADAAVPILPVTDTVKSMTDGVIHHTVDRSGLGLAQTPQAFRVEALRAAHEKAEADGIEATDDAALLEGIATVVSVAGDPSNVKITTMLDLANASVRMGSGGA